MKLLPRSGVGPHGSPTTLVLRGVTPGHVGPPVFMATVVATADGWRVVAETADWQVEISGDEWRVKVTEKP